MPNVSRWMKYAKARLDAAIGQGHRDLDELEARREAELADKPWLGSESDAPTFDEARARIEWQAARAAEARAAQDDGPTRGPAEGSTAPTHRPGTGAAATGGVTADSSGLVDHGAAAEAASAKVELEARERATAARLEAIRDELGIEPPDGE